MDLQEVARDQESSDPQALREKKEKWVLPVSEERREVLESLVLPDVTGILDRQVSLVVMVPKVLRVKW